MRGKNDQKQREKFCFETEEVVNEKCLTIPWEIVTNQDIWNKIERNWSEWSRVIQTKSSLSCIIKCGCSKSLFKAKNPGKREIWRKSLQWKLVEQNMMKADNIRQRTALKSLKIKDLNRIERPERWYLWVYSLFKDRHSFSHKNKRKLECIFYNSKHSRVWKSGVVYVWIEGFREHS